MSAARTAQAGNAYSPLGNVIQGIGTNPYLAQGVGNWMSGTPNYGGQGGGITSAGMQAQTYVPYGGGEALPLGYANF
jgi:hypothetical protein